MWKCALEPADILTTKLCELRQDLSSYTKLAYSDKNKRMNVEIAMRKKSAIVDRTNRVLRWTSDTMEIDTELSTVSKTSTIAPRILPAMDTHPDIDRWVQHASTTGMISHD